jgi:hypothetical protein
MASMNNVVILAHAMTKEGSAVSQADIDRAITRKRLFEKRPETYTYVEEDEDGKDG